MRHLPLLVSVALAASPYDYSPGAFNDSSLCVLRFLDSYGASFGFDLTPLQRFFTLDAPYNYTLNGCGTLPLNCSGCIAPYSSALQEQEVLSIGPPLHALADPQNASSGGLLTLYTDAWTQSSDTNKCSRWDPATGRELGRSLRVLHVCSPGLAVPELTGVQEGPMCVYTYTLASAAACGVAGGHPERPATPPTPAPPSGPLPAYLCSPNLTDAQGAAHAFPGLAALFSAAGGYALTASQGQLAGTALAFNLCGQAAAACVPPYPVARNFGAVVAQWPGAGAGAGAGASSSNCALANGTAAQCTAPCRVVGGDAPPHWELADASNGASGGVRLAWQGLLAGASEPAAYRCGYDASGNPLPMRVTLAIACSAQANGLVLGSASAGFDADGGCSFAVTASSAAACAA